MHNFCYIYKITNIINGKFYVGQTWETLNKRLIKHQNKSSSCIKLRNAINKYGKENFIISAILICHTQNVADYWETYFIDKYDAIKNGYNILAGGQLNSRKGIKHSEETKVKMSNSRKGKSSPNKGKIGAMAGKKHTNTAKENMSKAAQLRVNNGILPMLGKHHSDISKQKISQSNKGVHKNKTWKLINGKRVWMEIE